MAWKAFGQSFKNLGAVLVLWSVGLDVQRLVKPSTEGLDAVGLAQGDISAFPLPLSVDTFLLFKRC